MRTLFSILTLVAAFHTADAARLLHSIPEDTYAFPKFRVTFLNSLPLINETAERWLKDGLHGGELEFLDRPWKEDNWPSHSSRKEIDSGQPPSDDISMTDVYLSFLLVPEHGSVFPIVYIAIICSSR
jgi:protein OS-9